MPLDFPNSPAIGATYSPAGVSKSWIYTGEQWSAITAPIEEGASVTVSDTPPSGASAGDLWFDSSSGVTSVYYDGTWVDVGGGDSGTSAGSVNGIVKSDGAGNFSAAVAGTDYLTSADLQESPFAPKAWVNFGAGSSLTAPITSFSSYNVSSVTRLATTGTAGYYYRITFATPGPIYGMVSQPITYQAGDATIFIPVNEWNWFSTVPPLAWPPTGNISQVDMLGWNIGSSGNQAGPVHRALVIFY